MFQFMAVKFLLSQDVAFMHSLKSIWEIQGKEEIAQDSMAKKTRLEIEYFFMDCPGYFS